MDLGMMPLTSSQLTSGAVWNWRTTLALIWVLAAFIGAMRLAREWLIAAKLVQWSRPLDDPALDTLDEVASVRHVQVRSRDALLSPFFWQFRQTILVIPLSVLDLAGRTSGPLFCMN